jgi:hypothetical protein
MRKRVAVYGSGPCIRIYSFASAYRIKPTAVVDGVKTFPVSNWTAYA